MDSGVLARIDRQIFLYERWLSDQALGCTEVTTACVATEVGALWSRYASGDHTP
ncbi:hypothetical protein [Kitasatospora sp. NPDC093102]|uniref:hypothetical protein n=1 Tax=Kitasatospora sp. NPDC093102 TaxID=3155069 RepID=UPI0034224483